MQNPSEIERLFIADEFKEFRKVLDVQVFALVNSILPFVSDDDLKYSSVHLPVCPDHLTERIENAIWIQVFGREKNDYSQRKGINLFEEVAIRKMYKNIAPGKFKRLIKKMLMPW